MLQKLEPVLSATDDLVNIELEQELLGTVLDNPDCLRRIGDLDPQRDLSEPLHVRLYEAMALAAKEGRLAGPSVLKPCFSGEEISEYVDVPMYLQRLTGVAAPWRLDETVAALRDLGLRRDVHWAAERLADASKRLGASLADVVGDTVHDLDRVLASARQSRTTQATAFSAANDLLDALDRGDLDVGVTSGLLDVDRVTGGWRRSELTLVAARPSMGKTTFALSAAVATARKGGSVLLFSMEMSRRQLMARVLADLTYNSTTPIDYTDILKRNIDTSAMDRLRHAQRMLESFDLRIDDARGITVSEIAARSRAYAEDLARSGKRLDLVMIDYIGLIRPSDRYAGNRVQEVGEVSKGLTALAGDLDVPVVALSQLNRGTEGRENKRPALADLRDTGELEQDADTVMFLYRPVYYIERSREDDHEKEAMRLDLVERLKHDLEVVVAKNRNGPCCTIRLWANMGTNSVRDAAR